MIYLGRRIIFLLFMCGALRAEIALAAGLTQGRLWQTVSGAENYRSASALALRTACFVEFDSVGHPLFLPNDQVVYGLGILSECRYRDAWAVLNRYFSFPLYATYYLNFGAQAVGIGLNLNIVQLRYRNYAALQGQQLGKHIFWRINGSDNYWEFGLMQLCAEGTYPAEDVVSFYDTTNFILRYGFYWGGKNVI
ncbi:hypothetical protein NO2_0910 [Candidatus Termititenax persephonae]|uniref:Uncharacterized protein n=1 Tax=Candidatus Termititenax persephonae TaxID=2218525 RepID=A0A388TGU9_9BACT|nr:hypothetical protein NO2_0910 [Candidatus Termititenax persephonae]